MVAGVFGMSSTLVSPPAHADMMGNAFLNALNDVGIQFGQPETTMATGRSICPEVLSPGGTLDAVVAEVAELNGFSTDMAAAFAIVAISTYCPSLLSPLFPRRLQA